MGGLVGPALAAAVALFGRRRTRGFMAAEYGDGSNNRTCPLCGRRHRVAPVRLDHENVDLCPAHTGGWVDRTLRSA